MSELHWKAPEFEYYKKSVSWYWSVIVIAMALAFVALWQKNLLFLIFVILAVMVVFVWGKKKPALIDYKLTDKKITVGKNTYDLQNFAGFHLDEKTLIFKNKGRFSLYLKIPIKGKDEETIKSRLKAFLPEIEYKESITDALANWLGF